MCGIIALLLHDYNAPCAPEISEGLTLLQHRGQDAAGIVTCGSRGRLYQCKGNGMVRDVIQPERLVDLIGGIGVGHVRYPTAGSSSHSEAQPFYVNSPYGLVFAHNGNLVNANDLRTYLDRVAHRHVNTDSDSELLLNVFANNLQKTGKARINEEDIFTAISDLYKHCHGGYACVGMLAGFGIIGFRDPNGIRPIVYGRRPSLEKPGPGNYDYMFASESVALDVLGFTDIQDVAPGEAVIIRRDGLLTKRTLTPSVPFRPCIFEYVYFARPDSIIDGVSVYKSRLEMGERLAEKIRRRIVVGKRDMNVDVVIPVPDTSRTSALQVAQRLGLKYREGFVKNRYVGRTFIMPGQTQREKSVRRKLNPMALEFKGKDVLLVDDSIVRGTTSKEIVQMARDAGAKRVYFASAAPPVRFSNVYGIDMPSRKELVAFGRDEEAVAEAIGADEVIYQDLDDLVDACRVFTPEHFPDGFDTSVFDGDYVTPGVDQAYLDGIEAQRNDSAKSMRDQEAPETIGLHNGYRLQK